MVILRSLVTTGAIFLYGLQEAHGQDVAADGGITCPEIFQTPGMCLSDNNESQGENKLTCTAGDIEKAEPNEAKVEVQEIITGCTGPDSTATFKADLTYTVSGGATRYDIGLYIASDADANGDVGNCNIFSFGCQDILPDDGDLCGDRQGFNREQGLVITAACVANAEGQFKVPYCFSYSQNIADVTCTDAAGGFEGDPQPFQAIPGAPSKCQCDDFDLGDQICLVNLNLDANELQPTCTVDGLADIVIFGADIAIVGAVGDTFEYEISPGNGPQDYSAGDEIVIANPSSETTYTIVVRRTSDPTVACEDTFEITTGPCGPDTCDDTADFAGCEAGFSLIDPAAECVDALDMPTDCTSAICCVQDTCASYTVECAPGTSSVDDTVLCDGECSAETCCDQDTCADDFDVSNCELGTVPVADLTIECGEDCALTCCEPCDTAYGCASVIGEGEDASCDSPPLNLIDGVAASRWGWYIEPVFDGTRQVLTFDMYAGAGGNDLAKGEYAGSIVVTVNSDGSSGEPEASPEGDYCFDDIHVHVGNSLPTQTQGKKTSISVAPGQYTQTDVVAGSFYVIVHVGFACSPCGIPA